jgi:hypothetical protein
LAGTTALFAGPVTAATIGTGMVIYGITDYVFDIGGYIDENINEIRIYDK